MFYGVDYELFWILNPRTLQPFIKAFELKRSYDDGMAWQNGIYIKMAIASSFDEKCEYPKEPLTHIKKKSPEEIQQEIKEKMFIKMKQVNSLFREDVTINE